MTEEEAIKETEDVLKGVQHLNLIATWINENMGRIDQSLLDLAASNKRIVDHLDDTNIILERIVSTLQSLDVTLQEKR